jgi:hypothetical protein
MREIGINGEKWIQLAQDRVQWWVIVNTVINPRVHKESNILLTNRVTISFSNNIVHFNRYYYVKKWSAELSLATVNLNRIP